MVKNITNFCKECDGGVDVINNLGKTIKSCNKDINIGANCFTKNKLELMINPHNELEINTKQSSYVKFMIEYEEQLAKLHTMRRNSVNDLLFSSPVFNMNMYKKIDVLFTKMGSWYSRVIITLKKLLLSGHYCPFFNQFLIKTIEDYYKNCDIVLDCEISPILLEEMSKYLYNELVIPTHNGEFVNTLIFISNCLNNLYKIMITQYANDYQIEEGNSVLYYSTDFREVSKILETRILETRMKQLIGEFGTFRIGVPNSDELDDIEKVKTIKEVFEPYKENITNYDNF